MNRPTRSPFGCRECNSTFCLESTSNGTQVHRTDLPIVSTPVSCCILCATPSTLPQSPSPSYQVYLIIFCSVLALLLLLLIVCLVYARTRRSHDAQSPEESTSQGFKRRRIAAWVDDAGRQVFDPLANSSTEEKRQDVLDSKAATDAGGEVGTLMEEMPRRPVLPPAWVQYVKGEGIQMSVGDNDEREETKKVNDVILSSEQTGSHVSLSDQFGKMTTSSERSRSITESKSESR